MGKVATKDRIISKDRGKISRKTKNVILFGVEGSNKTEKIYLSNFMDRKSPYIIKFASGNETDLLKIVNGLISDMNRLNISVEDGDKVYCVIDMDTNPVKNKDFLSAVGLAQEHGIEIITSVPSIELWFLLHFEYSTASLSNQKLLKKLKRYIPEYKKSHNVYPIIKDKTHYAINNAKRLEKFQISNGNRIGLVEANPNTQIYKVIENLIKDNQ